jgi:sulfotransferase famil protein
MDAHWRPQHLNLGHGLIEYDLVGRLETFTADAARVRDATGMPDIPMPQWNASKRHDARLLDGRPDLLRKVHETTHSISSCTGTKPGEGLRFAARRLPALTSDQAP